MMKNNNPQRAKKLKVLIIVFGSILTSLLLLPFFFFWVILPIDSLFWPKGKYHIPTYVEQTDYCFSIGHDVYFVTDTYYSYKRLYKYEQEGDYIACSLDFQNKHYSDFSSFATNDNYIFLSSDNELLICDGDLQVIKTFTLEGTIHSFAANSSSLFFLEKKENETNMHCFSIENDDITLISEKINTNTTYFYNGSSLYVNYKKELFILSSSNTFIAKETSADLCEPDYGIIEAELQSKEVSFSFNEKNVSFETLGDTFYSKFYLKVHKVLFACYKKYDNPECKVHSNCICKFGESALYCFDLEKLQLDLISEYSFGSFLIDYDYNGAQYYLNGKLYDKESFVGECKLIEVGDKITMYKGDGMKEINKRYYLSYYNEKFYGI